MPVIYYNKEGSPVGTWKDIKKFVKPDYVHPKMGPAYQFGPEGMTHKLVEPITLKDLQELFGVEDDGKEVFSARKFQRLIKRGCLKVTRIGRFTFLTEKQEQEWMNNHEVSVANNFTVACEYCRKKYPPEKVAQFTDFKLTDETVVPTIFGDE